MRKVHITSTEDPYSLKVVDEETGEAIENITSISISMHARDAYALADITAYNPKVALFGYARVETVCPYCNNVFPEEKP